MNQTEEKPSKLEIALSFDDVTLDQGYADFLPQEADVTTHLTRNVRHNIPIISAAMDTITESRMAIEMAQLGGSGVIHRNLAIDKQVEEVRKVKNAWNLVVQNPLTVNPSQTLREAKRIMNQTSFGGLPVVDQNQLVGIITSKDTKYFTDLDTPVSAMMTGATHLLHIMYSQQISQAEYFRTAEKMFQSHKIDHLPLVIVEDGKFILKGLITYEDARKRRKYKNACLVDDRLVVGAAVGCKLEGKNNDIERAEALLKEGKVDYLVIDSSHGFSKGVVETLKKLREALGNQVDIVAGNVCNGAAAEELIKYGADAVKVGVGPGSICTTRRQTGAGVPQITATYRAALAAVKSGVPIITDGGIEYPGHAAKSIAAGASCVMVGSVLSGTYETPGMILVRDGKKVKTYRGMGSLDAMLGGSADRYAEDVEDLDLRGDDVVDLPLEQGISATVTYKGRVYRIVNEFVQGIKHGMGLAGCRTIAEMKDVEKFYTKFKMVTAEGQRESGIHGLK